MKNTACIMSYWDLIGNNELSWSTGSQNRIVHEQLAGNYHELLAVKTDSFIIAG